MVVVKKFHFWVHLRGTQLVESTLEAGRAHAKCHDTCTGCWAGASALGCLNFFCCSVFKQIQFCKSAFPMRKAKGIFNRGEYTYSGVAHFIFHCAVSPVPSRHLHCCIAVATLHLWKFRSPQDGSSVPVKHWLPIASLPSPGNLHPTFCVHESACSGGSWSCSHRVSGLKIFQSN